jgi:GGDEF domain-containing protein
MKHLRRSIIALVIGLAVFYNVERLDVSQKNVVNIATFVYILATVAVVLTIRLRLSARFRVGTLIAATVAIYVLIRLWFFSRNGFFHHTNIYLFVSEISFLSLLTWLAHSLTHELNDFEEAVANVTLAGSSRSPRLLDESVKEIQDQMYLSRRYDRPLSVVVLECDPASVQIMLNRSVQDVQRAMMSRYVASSMVRVLDNALRRTDLMLQHREAGRFVLICPETDPASLRALLDRIRMAASQRLGVSVNCGIASFPDGALTFDELLNKAESQLSQTAQDDPLKHEEKAVAMERG